VDGHAIVATHLRRVYRKGRRLLRRAGQIVAVDDVSFTVPRGTIFGLLGPNGAGKTTTIKMLSTLLIPTAGTATVGGYDVVRDERLVRRQLGVVLGGDRGLYAKLSARDNLILFRNLYGMTRESIARRADEMLDLVNLPDRAGERVEGFSRGMKQRLHLAKALLHDPPILILDEPTIGLDPAAAVDLRRGYRRSSAMRCRACAAHRRARGRAPRGRRRYLVARAAYHGQPRSAAGTDRGSRLEVGEDPPSAGCAAHA
jgi:ABC-2 type transport system ATP-binding protein